MSNSTILRKVPGGPWQIAVVLVVTFAGVLSADPVSAQISVRTSDIRATSSADIVWPGWLGLKRDGWVADFQPPSQWPEQLTKQWQTAVGTGYGSPLVAHGRVYQHARQGEDEVLWCLDIHNGDVIWRQSQRVPFKVRGGGEKHGSGPKSSPVYADGRIFTMSITGDLTAWNADSGQRLWRSDYGTRFNENHPWWGASTSPYVHGQSVILHFGNDEAGVLVALNAATGKEIWSHGKDGASYSSPLVVEIQGVWQVVEWNHRALVGVEIETGRFLWEYPFPHVGSDQNMPTPAFYDGRVLLGGENRGLHSLEPQFKDGLWSVTEHWHQKDVALNMSSAVINDGLLYGFSHYKSGQLFCLDPATGNVLWYGPPRTGENVMLLAFPGHIAALIHNGKLKIIKATGDRFELIRTYHVADSETWAPPVLLSDGVLVKDSNTLTKWSFHNGANVEPNSVK